MEPLYTVYFGGEVLAGQDPAGVRERLGQLFKVGDGTLDRLFNGKLHVLKRDCDKATALKYKQAMERAGAKPVIKPAGETGATPPAARPSTAGTGSAAEKIAALAAAPDMDEYRSGHAPEPAPALSPFNHTIHFFCTKLYLILNNAHHLSSSSLCYPFVSSLFHPLSS